MLRIARPSRYASRLQSGSAPAEKERVERLLALARVELAACCLAAIYLDPTEPSRYAALAYGLMVAYVGYSAGIALWLRLRPAASATLQPVTQVVDIVWAVALTLFTAGSSSPFFVFFLFILLAAAYRWGYRETLWTAGAAVLLLLAEAVFVGHGPLHSAADESFELNRLVIRSSYLVLMGLLLAYLAEREKVLRAETNWLARVIAKTQQGYGLKGTLEAVLRDVLHLFEASEALLAVKEIQSGQYYLCEARRLAQSDELSLHFSELRPLAREKYLFASPATNWRATRANNGGWEVFALDSDGRRVRNPQIPLGHTFDKYQSLLSASFQLGEEWSGRLFLADVPRAVNREAELQFLHRILREVALPVYNVYLMRRLRSHIGAAERSRLARELHDGPIQSLLAAEIYVNTARRQSASASPMVKEELERVEQLIHQEVLSLRELMENMKPVHVTPDTLLDCLRECVGKFRRETEISAEFVSELDKVHLSPYVCRELMRITQEALVNVRKHSGASEVLVRFGRSDGQWILVIDDNGRGFPFTGRIAHAEMNTNGLGPAVIKERVRSIHGELVIDSELGQGARLEVLLPQRSGWGEA